MKIGYTGQHQDQDLALQLDALTKIGCEKLYQEKRTGSSKERPQLKKMRDQLRPNDHRHLEVRSSAASQRSQQSYALKVAHHQNLSFW